MESIPENPPRQSQAPNECSECKARLELNLKDKTLQTPEVQTRQREQLLGGDTKILKDTVEAIREKQDCHICKGITSQVPENQTLEQPKRKIKQVQT